LWWWYFTAYAITITIKIVWVSPTTVNLRAEISSQVSFGGGGGMQSCGYEGSHSEPEEEEEEEKKS
jgi:hypothetical protein